MPCLETLHSFPQPSQCEASIQNRQQGPSRARRSPKVTGGCVPLAANNDPWKVLRRCWRHEGLTRL
ncbi:hypothetical protein E2C01_003751 [Portunus trituberculatus]|uniref:Uncharacterized protein n=1 Tax=Portunus trituberculatus TaxID=210409 RepID=A0A5B7CPK9_PORTR|nr:hypothetical protein [Portunus trituberculatus]